MGIWGDDERRSTRASMLIQSPQEEKRPRDASDWTREGAIAGAKAAGITAVITSVPTIAACRMIPWAKANLNYTAQALIISGASIAAYFITADKTILEGARRNADYSKTSRFEVPFGWVWKHGTMEKLAF